ncbi:MAG: MerR family transcriptional regulator [bacterium]
MPEIDKDKPVYVISVVAKMLDISQQTLRLYEKEKLVVPKRTSKNTRLYSVRDVEELRRITRLHQELGVNLAGIDVILHLLHKMDKMQNDFLKLVEFIREKLNIEIEDFTNEDSTSLVPVHAGKLTLIQQKNTKKKNSKN